ncbi:MAG: hypothetical protein ACTSYF_01265 [Promethearchaeota archaeon]
MILPKEDEIYITANKTLYRFDQNYWIYNWKGLVWYIIDNKNANKIIMGQHFEHFHRFETDPSLEMIESIIS